MAGTHITITVDDAQARELLTRLGQSDTGNLMPRLGEYLLESTQQRFDKQIKPSGVKWDELSPAYARRKKYHKDKILTLRGYLRSSIRYRVTGAHSVEVGTNIKYAAIHQFGGSIEHNAQSRRVRFRSVAGRVLFAGKRHKKATERWVTRGAYQAEIKARPFLGVSAADEKEIQDIVMDWFSSQNRT